MWNILKQNNLIRAGKLWQSTAVHNINAFLGKYKPFNWSEASLFTLRNPVSQEWQLKKLSVATAHLQKWNFCQITFIVIQTVVTNATVEVKQQTTIAYMFHFKHSGQFWWFTEAWKHCFLEWHIEYFFLCIIAPEYKTGTLSGKKTFGRVRCTRSLEMILKQSSCK